MSIRLRTFHRLAALALPCWLVAGPLAYYVEGAAACDRHAATHQHHSESSDAPCWCNDMSGTDPLTVSLPPALPPAAPAAIAVTVPVRREAGRPGDARPPSPAYPPTHPPPNGRR